ncbi:MAG: SAM-dependent chlorinase/fluorinase, partial [Nitrococcus sp.]|nr:SAM-dependent chlorinase/fluorinase [Nitrococcus sp.]
EPVIAGKPVRAARTFADVTPGTAFWYCNSIGLVEIAVNQGSAARRLGLQVGDSLPFQQLA